MARETSAQRIGTKLEAAMRSDGHNIDWLAEQTGKQVGHLKAVLAGYPNSTPSTTMLDRVDEIAAALG